MMGSLYVLAFGARRFSMVVLASHSLPQDTVLRCCAT
jgi:hypothetical protein